VKHIKNFTIFLFESEEFTKEDYLNFKQYTNNSKKGIPSTKEQMEAMRKYHRMKRKGLDPIDPFREKKGEKEEFTEEDRRNFQEYNKKIYAKPRLEPTQKEREAYNKYSRQKRILGHSPFKRQEGEFTEEDYRNLKEYNKKVNAKPKLEPTQKEKEAYNKYNRLRAKGLDPIAPFRRKEEEFTEEDYRNFKEYSRKYQSNRINTKPRLEPTEKEREAYNKYQRQRKISNPIAPLKKQEEEFTEEDYRNFKEYNKKINAKPRLEPTQKEKEAYNKYNRIRTKGLDPIAPFRRVGEFTEEDYRNYQEYNKKINAKPKLEPTQKEREAYNKYYRIRRLSGLPSTKGQEEEFTEEEYRNYQEYNKKVNPKPRLEPTQKEKGAYNKYQRMLTRGLDPTAAFTGKIRIITATGDWSKLTLDGSPLFLSHANTYFVTFYKNPTKEMIKRLLGDDDHPFTCDPKEASQEIFGGDFPYINKKEGLIFAADPKYSPADYENELVRTAKTICENPDENENMDGEYALHILENGWENFTPEHINHLILLASESAKKPSAYNIFSKDDIKRIDLFLKFAKYNLKGQPLKLMDPRIEIKFKVV